MRFLKRMSSVSIVLGGLGIGVLVPQLHVLAWLVRWLVMVMLFLVFLQTRLRLQSLRPSHGLLLAANIAIALVAGAAGWVCGGRDLGLAAFFAGIAPTATAAPVFVGFLRREVDYAVTSFFVTNLSVGALVPAVLPLVVGTFFLDAFLHVLHSMAVVMFIPATVAILLRRLYPPATLWPTKIRRLPFALWSVALVIIAANASHFIRTQSSASLWTLLAIALAAGAICFTNFSVGRWVGGASHRLEGSQSLGQKNTTLAIYLAMTYGSPLIALGPTCYVLWHNLWNAWQLYRAEQLSASANRH